MKRRSREPQGSRFDMSKDTVGNAWGVTTSGRAAVTLARSGVLVVSSNKCTMVNGSPHTAAAVEIASSSRK